MVFKRRHDVKPDAHVTNPDRFRGLYTQVYDGEVIEKRPEPIVDSYGNTVPSPPAPPCRQDCTLVYMPLLPNERAVPGNGSSTAKL